MNQSFATKIVPPVIAGILCCMLYLSGYFQIILAALIVLVASVVEYKKEIFRSLGFQRERVRVKSLLVVAPLFGTAFFLFYYYLMIPVVTSLTGEPMDFSVFESYKGNLPASMGLLVFIWASAAFGEEIVFRGYFMRQFTKFFGSGNVSLVINILLFGFLFGWVHAYQGLSGQILAGILGMVFAIIFQLRKDDLWFNIAAHGFFDTVGLLFIYHGWG